MHRRILGRTGLEVTQLSYGAMEIRGKRIWGGRPITDEQAERILNAVLDTDVNKDGTLDTGLFEWSQGQVSLIARTGTVLPGVPQTSRVALRAGLAGRSVVDGSAVVEVPGPWIARPRSSRSTAPDP